MADQNLQTSGIADVLNSLGQGYLQGQQTLIARRAAAANLMRQQALINIQQQKADAQDTHNNLLSEHYGNQDTNGAQRVDYYGDHGLTEALQRYDMGAGGGKLPPDQYYQGVKNLVKTYGKDPAQYGVPPQYLDGYTPPANADGTPGTAPTVDPNALVGPTAKAKNDQVTALGGYETAKTGALNLKSVEGLLAAVGKMPADKQAGYLQGLYAGSPTSPQIPIPGVTPVGQQQPAILGPGRGGAPIPFTSDPSSIGQNVVPPISPVLASPYTPDIKTQADVDRLGSVTKVNEARLPIMATIPDLNRARTTLDNNLAGLAAPGGPKARLIGAQANNAQSEADLHALMRQYLPQMDESLINSRNMGPVLRGLGIDSTLSTKKQANLKELSRIGFVLNSPRDKNGNTTITTGKDANGQPITQTYTPQQLQGFADQQQSLKMGNAQIDRQLTAIRGMGGPAAGETPPKGSAGTSGLTPVPGSSGLAVDASGNIYKNGIRVTTHRYK